MRVLYLILWCFCIKLFAIEPFVISSSEEVDLNSPLAINLNNGQITTNIYFKTVRDIVLTGQNTVDTKGIFLDLGSITGTGGFLKLGPSTMVLNGIGNFYSGVTTVREGYLQAALESAFSPNSIIVVEAGGTLDLNNFNNQIQALRGEGTVVLGSAQLHLTSDADSVFSGNIFGLGGLVKNGAGTLALSGRNNYFGETQINEGNLNVLSDFALSPHSPLILKGVLYLNEYTTKIQSLAGSGSLNLGSGTLIIGNPEETNFSGEISGLGGITYEGTTPFQLTGTHNSYSGITHIISGTLKAGGLNAFSSSSFLSIDSGSQLDLNGYDNEIAGLSGDGLVLVNEAILTFGNDNQTTVFSGAIEGVGGIIKTGSGSTTFSGSNTYSGVTAIDQGQLLAGSQNTFSPYSEVNLSDSRLGLNGFDNRIGNLSGSGIVSLGNAILTLGDAQTTGFFGAISGVGGITKEGSGTLIFYGKNNTYSGVTTLNQGALKAGDKNVFSKSSEIRIGSSAVLDLNHLDNCIRNLSGSGEILLGSGVLTLGDSNSRNFSGKISGSGGIVKQGAGSLTLEGQGSTYSGQTLILAGVIRAASDGSFSPNSEVLLGDEGALDLNNYANTILNLSGSGTLLLGSGILSLGSSESRSYAGAISGSGGIIKEGSGTLILSGVNNFYSGMTLLKGGTLLAAAQNSLSPHSRVILNGCGLTKLDLGSNDNTILNLSGDGRVYLGAGTLTLGDELNTTFSGQITSMGHKGGIIKIGSGTFTLSGIENTYGGETKIANGALQASEINCFSKNSAVIIEAGATLDLNHYSNTIRSLSGAEGSSVILGSAFLTLEAGHSNTRFAGSISGTGGLIKKREGTLILSGANTYSGETSIIDGGAISISGDQHLGNTPLVKLNNGTLLVTGSPFTLSKNIDIMEMGTIDSEVHLTIAGSLSGEGRLIKSGEGSVCFTGSNNTFRGPAVISAGSLHIGGIRLFPSNSQLLDASKEIYLDFRDDINSISNLYGCGNIDLDNAQLVVGNELDSVYAGIISGSGSVVKKGCGFLELTGNQSYTGVTQIEGGTLSVNGFLNSQTIVGFGARLQGNGVFGQGLVNYGTVAPGNSIGHTVVNGAYTQAAGSTLEIEVSPTDSDLLTATGIITIDGNTTLEIIPFLGSYTANTTYEIIYSHASISGEFTYLTFAMERASGFLTYGPDTPIETISVTFTVLPFQAVATGSNSYNVANILNAFTVAGTPSWTDQLTTLFYLSNNALNDAYTEIAPSNLKAFAVIQENNGIRVQDAISYRFQNLLDEMQCLAHQGCNSPKYPVYMWIDSLYTTLNQSTKEIDSNYFVGYHSSTAGGSLGVDFNLFDCCYFGLMAAGTSTALKWVDDGGSGDIYSGYGGVYAAAIGNGPYVNSSFLIGASTYKGRRHIIYPEVNETADSKHQGMQYLAHLDFGWNFSFKGYTLRPFESADYILQHENRFHEHGAGVLDLKIRSTAPQLFRNELGLGFAKCFSISKRNTLMADIKLAWVLEERFNGTNFVSSFEGMENETFTTAGYFPNRSLFSPGASLTANFCDDRAQISLNYDAEFCPSYFDQAFQAQISFKF
jgi:fibronectin-binding autotransporter adhesin